MFFLCFFCVVIVVIKIQRNKNFAPAVALLVHCPFRVFFCSFLVAMAPKRANKKTPAAVAVYAINGQPKLRWLHYAPNHSKRKPWRVQITGQAHIIFSFCFVKILFCVSFCQSKKCSFETFEAATVLKEVAFQKRTPFKTPFAVDSIWTGPFWCGGGSDPPATRPSFHPFSHPPSTKQHPSQVW